MDPGQVERYYLGRLTDEEQRDLETRCFEDDGLFAALMEGQTDLVHAYVRGRMSSSDREAFETHFLATPAGRRKVDLTRTLLEAIGELGEERGGSVASVPTANRKWSDWLRASQVTGHRWMPAATLAATVIVATALVVDDWRVRGRLERLTDDYGSLTKREQDARQVSEAERARADRLSEALRQVQSKGRPVSEQLPTLAGSVAALPLAPGLARADGTAAELRIRRGVTIALFELALDNAESVRSYRVVIETADGREVWRQDTSGFPPAGAQAAVVVAVDAATLEPGAHIVRLQQRTPSAQAETIHTYQFHVVRDAGQ